MSSYSPVFRLTVYAPVSAANPNETDVLTPATNAPHSDAFKVASAQNITGYQPYLGIPQGGGSKVSLPECQTSIGEFSVDLFDFRTGTSNLERWVTAFVGDNNRLTRLCGRKVVVEESLDGGTTWAVFYVGRIFDFVMKNAQIFTMKIRDVSQGLKAKIFDQPNFDDGQLSYLAYQSLFPVGFNRSVGTLTAANTIRATITNIAYVTANNMGSQFAGAHYTFTIDKDYLYNDANIVTNVLMEAVQASTVDYESGYYETDAIGVVTNLTKGSTGEVTVFEVTTNAQIVRNMVSFRALAHIVPLTTWAEGDEVTFYIKAKTPRENARLWLVDVHPVQVWKDALDGKFFASGSTSGSNPTRPFRLEYDTSAMSTLLADTTIQPASATFAIPEPIDLNEFIEKHICLPYGLAYGVRQSGSVSYIYPFKTTLPESLPSYTITDDDITSDSPVEWTPGLPVTSVFYRFYSTEPNTNPIQLEQANGETLKDTPRIKGMYNPDGAYVGGQNLTIDAPGVRFVGLDFEHNGTGVVSDAVRNLNNFTSRFINGTAEIGLTTRRTGVIQSSSVGDWVVLDIERLPDANTHRRGGPRLAQVVEKTPMLGGYTMRLVDGGLTSSMASPSITALAVHPSSSYYGVRATVTTTEAASVRLEYAAVDIGASVPSQTSDQWTYARNESFGVETKDVDIWNVPSGQSIWVRARTYAPPSGTLKLPSPWVTYTASADTSVIAPPTGLTISGITLGYVTASWTNGSPLGVEVLLANPSGSTPTASLAVLESGSTRYVLTGLEEYSSSAFTVGVRHVRPLSTITTASFSVSGTLTALPSMSYFLAYVSD